MKRYFFFVFAILIFLSIPLRAIAAGWGEQQPLQFKLNSNGSAQTNESLRLSYDLNLGHANGSSSGSSNGGSGELQESRNLNNVIEISETYAITLNGNNNNVSTQGLILNGDQASGTTNQKGTNTTSANNSTHISEFQETGK